MLDDKSIFERIGVKTMNTPLLKYVDIYQVTDEQNVTFNVEIGERQAGLIDVGLNGNLLVDDRPFKVENLDLGLGANLKGKLLNFIAIVDDVSDSNDKASITYTFQGGKSDFAKTRPYVFIDGHKTVIFRIQVKFE